MTTHRQADEEGISALGGDGGAGGGSGAERGSGAESAPWPDVWHTLVASDLDRTLIYSSPAALKLADPEVAVPPMRCVEMYRGNPLSFLTEQAIELLTQVTALATFVPCTTRTPEQYRRVELPIPKPRYAITTNGGHLLVDGESDPSWEQHVRQRLLECASLREMRADLLAATGPEWLVKERVAEDMFFYLVVRRDRLPGDWVRQVTDWARSRGWTVSLQGRKMYFVPAPLTKTAALREIRRRTGARACLAAGDSLLDADLLRDADLGFRPGHGELADVDWSAPRVIAVPETGVLGGEEILRRIHGAIRGGLVVPDTGGTSSEA